MCTPPKPSILGKNVGHPFSVAPMVQALLRLAEAVHVRVAEILGQPVVLSSRRHQVRVVVPDNCQAMADRKWAVSVPNFHVLAFCRFCENPPPKKSMAFVLVLCKEGRGKCLIGNETCTQNQDYAQAAS